MNEILINIDDKDLIVIFKKKKINFYKVKTKDKKKIIKIWEDTRNQYLKILNKLKIKKLIINLFLISLIGKVHLLGGFLY